MRRRALAAVLCALTLAACGDDHPPGESPREQARAAALRGDAERFSQQAAMALAEGNYERAAILSRRAVQSDVTYAGGHHMVAWAALYLGQDHMQVISALEAVRLAPDSATYRRTLGIAYEDAGRLYDAQQAYAEAVRLNPADTLSWRDLERIARENGYWQVADSAQRALEALAVEREAEPEGGIDSPPWQDAIRRGVDFRAVGQEPGWSLEVDREGRIVYAGDYGTDTLVAPAPEPTDGDAQTWTVRADGRVLVVRIREEDCRDTMSGERFSHAVAIDVDGRELNGCGRWLNP